MRARSKPTAKDSPADGSQASGWLAVAALAIGSLLYGYIFLLQGVRARVLSLLLRPEDLLQDWIAWDSAHFGCLDRVPLIGVAFVIALAAFGLGSRSLRQLLTIDELQPGERIVFAFGVGLSLLSLLTFLWGVAGVLHFVWVPRLAIGLLALLGMWEARQLWPSCRPAFAQFFSVENRFAQCLAAATTFFTLLLLWASLLPPWDFDVLEYHLQAPKEWMQAGQITFLPHNLYANMPLADEMLPLLAMRLMPGEESWWYGALAGKLLMALFVPLTALSLAAAGTRYHSPIAGWTAAAIYVGLPWLSHTALHGLNEPAVACFGWLALHSALLVGKVQRVEWLAGFFAGSATACKYPALLSIGVPTFFIVAILLNRQFIFWPRTIVMKVATCAVFIAIPFLPWLIKNELQTGNPVYPLAVNIFGGETRTPEKDARFREAHNVPVDSHGSRYGIRPASAALNDIVVANAHQSPLLLPFILAGAIGCIFVSRQPVQATWPQPFLLVAAFAWWIFLTWWLFTHRVDRFWIPALPPLAFLAGLGAAQFSSTIGRRVVAAILVLGFTFHFAFLVSPLAGDVRWFTRLDLLKTGEQLSQFDVARIPAHLRYLNDQVAADKAVLFVGDAAVFEVRPKCYYNTCWDDCLLVDWLADRSADERQKILDEKKVTWVCVNDAELARYRSPGNYGYDPRYNEELLTELVDQKVLQPVATALFQSSPEAPAVRLFRVVEID